METTDSLDNCIELFFKIGASRGMDVIPAFENAFNEDPDVALRIAQWGRDVRGGAGERQIYKDIMTWMATESDMGARGLMVKVPEVGRWDDLLSLIGTPLEKDALTLVSNGLLVEKDPLCAKWMPRKGVVAIKLRDFMDMSPKQYRKTLVELTNVVETKMCAKEWDSIEFDKLPSVASARYQKAFGRNATDKYEQFKADLSEGITTINAGAIYPYDCIKSLEYGDDKVANAQWDALPNYLEGSTENIIPLVDVSGSMLAGVGGSDSINCMDVAISLGLYISERSEGIFKNSFITFSSEPELLTVEGTLSNRYMTMKNSEWGCNTNLEKAFNCILNAAKLYNIPENEMPTKLLILSDMQFNSGSIRNKPSKSIAEKYNEAGYKIPDIIFWNLHDSGTKPLDFAGDNVALVSGFSPALMANVLKCENLTPEAMLKDTVCIERYDWC